MMADYGRQWEAVTKLTFRERVHMAWELTWPVSLLDLLVVVVIHGVLEAQGETLDSIWAVAVFFVVFPWVVRRALARPYGILRTVVVTRGEERPRLSYQQSLKVMWLLSWRPLLPTFLALLVISATLRLARVDTNHFIDSFSSNDPLANAVGLSVIDAITSMVFLPFVIPGMLRKRYRGFHLEVRESAKPIIKVPKGRQK
jgi:hypothetical protein